MKSKPIIPSSQSNKSSQDAVRKKVLSPFSIQNKDVNFLLHSSEFHDKDKVKDKDKDRPAK